MLAHRWRHVLCVAAFVRALGTAHALRDSILSLLPSIDVFVVSDAYSEPIAALTAGLPRPVFPLAAFMNSRYFRAITSEPPAPIERPYM